MKCISTNTLQKATSIHLLIAENSEFLRGNTSYGESESVEMDQMQIFPHRPASMSPWSTSTLVSKQCNRYYKKIIMMSQIQFCSQKFIRPTKAKRQDHPWSRRYFNKLRPCWLWTATSSWLTRTTATSTSSSASRSGNAWKALHVQPSWIKMTIDDAFWQGKVAADGQRPKICT